MQRGNLSYGSRRIEIRLACGKSNDGNTGLDEWGGEVADDDSFGRLDGIDTWTDRRVNGEVSLRSLHGEGVWLFSGTCSAKVRSENGEKEKLPAKWNWREEEKTNLGRKERDLETCREKGRDWFRKGILHLAALCRVLAIGNENWTELNRREQKGDRERERFWEMSYRKGKLVWLCLVDEDKVFESRRVKGGR